MDPLLHAVVAKLWGDLSPPVWLSQKFSLETDPCARFSKLYYELRCSRYERIRPGHLHGPFSAARSPHRGTISVEEHHVILEVNLNERELNEVMPHHPRDFVDVITTRILRQAHKIYLFDPRSGTRFDGLATPTPTSLLFDPPLSDKEREDLILGAGPFCCFCSSSEPGFVWGNAALMWVHEHCWGAVFGFVDEDK